MGRNIFKDEPETLLLFDTPWGDHHRQKSTIYERALEAQSTIVVTEDLKSDTLLHIENTGTTELLIFVNSNGELPVGSLINPGTELTAELSESGEGKYLKNYIFC